MLYSLRKVLKFSTRYMKYVLCPHCHSLYNEADCIVKVGGNEFGIMCDHVRYPNHPQRANRKKCGAELMKKVKIGQKYKLVP